MPNPPVPAAATGLPSVIHSPCGMAGDEPHAGARPQNCGEENQHLTDMRYTGEGSRHDGANWSSVPASQKKDEATEQLRDDTKFSPASGPTKLWKNPIVSSSGSLAKSDANEISGLPHGRANVPAPGTSLPRSAEQQSPYGAAPTGRRGFLRGLLGLPLLGGAVTLIGQPTAVAEPVSLALLETYRAWLHFEARAVRWELAGRDIALFKELGNYIPTDNAGGSYHSYDGSNPACGRAALVLATVGCDWREG